MSSCARVLGWPVAPNSLLTFTDVCRLDNFAPAAFKEGAAAVKARFPHALVEGSGGITEATAAEYMSPRACARASERWADDNARCPHGSREVLLFLRGGGLDVDVLSTSSIHQGVPHLDFSLKIVRRA